MVYGLLRVKMRQSSISANQTNCVDVSRYHYDCQKANDESVASSRGTSSHLTLIISVNVIFPSLHLADTSSPPPSPHHPAHPFRSNPPQTTDVYSTHTFAMTAASCIPVNSRKNNNKEKQQCMRLKGGNNNYCLVLLQVNMMIIYCSYKLGQLKVSYEITLSVFCQLEFCPSLQQGCKINFPFHIKSYIIFISINSYIMLIQFQF